MKIYRVTSVVPKAREMHLVNHSIRKKNLTTVTEAYVEAAGVNEATGAIIYYGEKQKKKRTLKDSGKKDETKKNQ